MQTLTKIKKEFFHNGFTIVNKVFTKKEIKKVRYSMENIKNKFLKIKNPNKHFTTDNKINSLHDINKFIKGGPISKLSKDKRITSIVEKILGEKSKVRNIEFFLKPKQTGRRAPFHQDNFYWNIKNKKALNVWIACTPSSYSNGGVCYYNKSHKKGLIKHQLSYEPGSSQKIPEKYLKNIKNKKSFPNLSIGDCIFHHCEVIHGSNKNNSEFDRVGLVLGYNGVSAKINKKGLVNYKKQLKINLKHLIK